MKQYLFVGDLHRDLKAALYAIQWAASIGAEILQVGDWGFLPDGLRLQDHTGALSEGLVRYGVRMRFIDGNHDNHPLLFTYSAGEDNVAPNLTYQPRGSLHIDEDGTRFVFLGGAPSIDKDDYVPGKGWFPEEEITVEQGWLAQSHGSADVLVTHDAPVLPPYSKPLPPSWEFTKRANHSREIIAIVTEALQPRILTHGHYHRPYEGRYKNTTIIGLGQNGLSLWKEMCFPWHA